MTRWAKLLNTECTVIDMQMWAVKR